MLLKRSVAVSHDKPGKRRNDVVDGAGPHPNADSHGNRKRLGEADIAFHLAIAVASGNQLYASLLSALKNRSIEYASITPKGLENFEEMIGTHNQIFKAIAHRKPDEAGNQMKAHLARSRALYLEQTGQSQNEPT